MRRVFIATLLFCAPAFGQSVPYSFNKTSEGKVDAAALQEDFETLYNQIHQQKVVTSNLTLNGVVVSVGASSPLCSSGGTNPSLSFCGSLAESQVTNLVSDLAAKASLAALTSFEAAVAASTASITAGGATTYLLVNGGNYMTGQFTTASTATVLGGAFSVGRSSFVVSGGSATAAYSMTAKSYVAGTSVGITSACAAGFYLSTGTVVGGIVVGGGCVRALQPTNWTPTLGGATIGAPNVCDSLTFNRDGLLTATNDPTLCDITESQVDNLTTDLSNKLSKSGPATFTGALTIVGPGSALDGLTVTNGSGINAYYLNTTTGITTGGASSTISGNLNVGTSAFPGNVVALSAGAGIGKFNDLQLFDASSPASSTTIQSTGGGRFGCNSGISSNCGVQTIGSDGRIPAISTVYFQSVDGSSLTNITDSTKVLKAGDTMSGTLQMSNNFSFASAVGNIQFVDNFYHSLIFKSTGSPQAWPLGEIQWIQGGTGMQRIIAFDSQGTYPGQLVIGADTTAGATGIQGVRIVGNPNQDPDVFVSTNHAVMIGTSATTGKFQVYTTSMSVIVSTQGAFDVSGGTTPTLSGCGASPTISAGSNCERGTLTMGAGASSSGCALGFPAICMAAVPKCVMSCGGEGAALACGQTANSTVACDTVTTGLAAACGTGTFVSWICLGN